jgi:hypothetical protein
MRSLSRSAARSSRRLLVLAAVAAVCTLGLIQPAAFAAGTQTLSVSGTGRYLRMYGTVRGTGYGYSLWEFQVFGT